MRLLIWRMCHVLYLAHPYQAGPHQQIWHLVSHDLVGAMNVRDHLHLVAEEMVRDQDEIIHAQDHAHLELRWNGVIRQMVSVLYVISQITWQGTVLKRYDLQQQR